MRTWVRPAVMIVTGLTLVSVAGAVPRYVNRTNPTPVSPYTSWATAATNIQDAVDVASLYDLVLVTNGVYDTGGRPHPNPGVGTLTNRVYVDNRVTLQAVSTNPADTIIVGAPDPGTGDMGPGAIRCVYLGVVAVLSGFTLTNGYTDTTSDNDGYGGGLSCDYNSTMATNCVIVDCRATKAAGVLGGKIYDCRILGNTATLDGGGAMQCRVLLDCMLAGNTAQRHGGGAQLCPAVGCTISNNVAAQHGGGLNYGSATRCVIVSNRAETAGVSGGGGVANVAPVDRCWIAGNVSAYRGGGCSQSRLSGCVVVGNRAESRLGAMYNGSAVNCTIVSNSAVSYEGGVGGGLAALTNCIVYYNVAPSEQNWADGVGSMEYCCTTPTNGLTGAGLTDAEPNFVDATASDYWLAKGSPCIDAGIYQSWMDTALDVADNPRIEGGGVDIGAYEYVPVPPGGTVIALR